MPTLYCPKCEDRFRAGYTSKTIGSSKRQIIYCKNCKSVVSIVDK